MKGSGKTKSIIEKEPYKECYICGSNYMLEEHHIYYGRGWRKLSEKYGLKVTLCHNCHFIIHFSTDSDKRKKYDELLKRQGQLAFEKTYNNLDFIEVMGRNYLD